MKKTKPGWSEFITFGEYSQVLSGWSTVGGESGMRYKTEGSQGHTGRAL